MKINVPITPEEHARADEEYKLSAERQKDFIHRMAERIEAGDTLNSFEAKFIAAVLRRAAAGISTKRPRRRGQPDMLPGELPMLFAMKVRIEGMSEKDAIAALAGEFDVETASIEKRLGYRGKGIEADQRKAETEDWLNTAPPKETNSQE